MPFAGWCLARNRCLAFVSPAGSCYMIGESWLVGNNRGKTKKSRFSHIDKEIMGVQIYATNITWRTDWILCIRPVLYNILSVPYTLFHSPLHCFIYTDAYMAWIFICASMCCCEFIFNRLYLNACVWVFSSVLIVCALFVCWMPNQVRRLMTAAYPKNTWSNSYLVSYAKLHPVADTFFYLSSVLNPLLYNLSSRQFRTAFLQMLCCRLSIQHVNKRTVEKSKASHASSHSLRPLLWKKSQHRSTQPSSRQAETLTPSADSSPVVQILNTPPSVSSETETWVMSSLLFH